MIGLRQDDQLSFPYWLLVPFPPIAAGAAVALAGLSVDVWNPPYALIGDWGRGASIALLVGATMYAVGLNLLARRAERRRQLRAAAPGAAGPAPDPRSGTRA
jgi:hypothetical protein